MIVLLAILCGLGRGLYEGMVMYPGGVRQHRSFWMYHALGVAFIAGFVYIGTMLYFTEYLTITACLIILWECTEVGYNISRFGLIVQPYEHVTFGDIVSFHPTGVLVYILHATRVLLGTALLVLSK